MSDDSRIMQLAEEVLDSKRSLADVCVEFPELLAEVRLRLRACQRIESELDAMFPPEGMSSGAQTVAAHVATALPEIPGYQVESLLGHGGMGVVFKARHLKLNRSVAIKMLLSGAFAGRMELSRFMREAEAVASLRHAHIVQLYDIGDLEGRPYFTMEFVEGGNLAEKLAGMPRPPRQAAAMLATLAGAIAAAHRGGIVHRDLKPANLLLTIEGWPKISDFGLAGRFEGGPRATGGATKLGTANVMG